MAIFLFQLYKVKPVCFKVNITFNVCIICAAVFEVEYHFRKKKTRPTLPTFLQHYETHPYCDQLILHKALTHSTF